MAEFDDRKQSNKQAPAHDTAHVQRRVDLAPPVPAPLAPAATPVQRLAFTQVQRQHQVAAVAPVLSASATLQRLAAENSTERLGLQRQIDGLRSSLPAGAERAAWQRQAERTQSPAIPSYFATPPQQRAGQAASSADHVGLYDFEAHNLQRSTVSGYVPQGHWQAIQRRAAEGLTRSYLRSGGPAVQRQAEFGAQLAACSASPPAAAWPKW